MTKHFCCCFSLKTGALIMAFISLMGGSAEIIGGGTTLYHTISENDTTFGIVCILVGLETVFSGITLLFGIVQGNEKYVLLYLLLGFINLFIVTIYTGITMFEYRPFLIVFFLSVFLWYCQFCIYNFYEEVAEYNTVKSGVIEISYNNQDYTNTAYNNDTSTDNTAV